MKLITCLLTLIILSGCATTNQFTVAEYTVSEAEKLPPIGVFLKQPEDGFRQECEEFDSRSVLHHCLLNRAALPKLHTELLGSGVFSDVLYARRDVDYQILISTARYNFEGGSDLGSAVVAGATLMLAPMSVSTNIKVYAKLLWRGHEVKNYQYDIPFQFRASLLSLNQDSERDIAKSIVSRLIRDFQKDDVFSGELLAGILKSSNYYTDLKMPETAGVFIKGDDYVYRHPFLGVQVRYLHPEFQFDVADVFVYPIRKSNWNNISEVLREESFNVRKDIELMQKEGVWSSISLGEDQEYSRKVNGQLVKLLSFYGDFVDKEQVEYETKTYLFLHNDKFVKIRGTFAKTEQDPPNMNEFVFNILKNIQTPEESLFMAKVRKQWRDYSTL